MILKQAISSYGLLRIPILTLDHVSLATRLNTTVDVWIHRQTASSALKSPNHTESYEIALAQPWTTNGTLSDPLYPNSNPVRSDYNYVRASDRSCQKVGEPVDPMGVCKQEGVIEWFETSGYRKVPLSTCEGGLNLDRQPTKSHPCPGKEDDYDHKRGGLRGWGLAYVILLTFGMAGLAGYIFWKKYADGRFGQIRLGEDASQPFYVRWPLIAMSGVWAAAVLLPDAIVSSWKWLRAKLTRTKRFTSRESFARGGYASLANESFTDAELLDDVEAGEEDI
jgi:hypothetical protein